jgi:diguanylate cyclase (GGDEF)-like protein/PAS domain S-box-containing protein
MDAAPHKIGLTRLPLLAAAFVTLVCVVIVGMSGAREWNTRATTLEAAEAHMANLARSLTQHAEDSIEVLDANILGAVSRLEIDGTGPATLAKLQSVLITRQAAAKRIHGLVVCDESGNWLASSVGIGANLRTREFFRHHLQSTARDVFIGHPVRSSVNGEWVFTVSRRFNHPDGSFAGVVFATIGAEYFSEFYRQFDIGFNSAIALLNADGIVIARNPDDGTYVGRDTSNGPLFQDPLLRSASGVYHFKSRLDGMRRVGFYERSDRFPLVILATMQWDEVLAPWRSAAVTRMMFVFALVSLIGIIGFFLVRQLHLGQHLISALASKEANFRVLAEGSSDMVNRIGVDERVSYASPSSVRILGWRPDQLVGTSALAGVNPLDLPRIGETVAALKCGEAEEARISYRTRHRQKSEIWLESTLRVTRKVSGEIDGVVAISRDVTEQKDLEERLETLAIEDGLTGLANRRRFDERLEEEWARAYRDGKSLSLLMIDVDHFKKFNDRYGHPAGDACLKSVANLLAAEARRPGDLAARYGGEEFALLLPGTEAAGCELIGERIREELRKLCIIHVLNLPSRRVTVSLGGATIWPNAERSIESPPLISAADRALYAAKGGGRDRLVMSGQVVPLLPVTSAAR